MLENVNLLDDQAVYWRTTRGQQELRAGSRNLSKSERRLLGMVTGVTSVRALMNMGLDAIDIRVAVPHLLILGLIAAVRDQTSVLITGQRDEHERN